MNKDQTVALALGLLKIIGAVFTTHGATKAAEIVNSEDTIGVVTILVGLAVSHWYNADSTTK